ncbi:MAG TPA: hypothetical protein VF826_09010 [Chloroflexia bacterium]
MPQNTQLQSDGRKASTIGRLAVWFLILQATGTTLWWVVLILYPGVRAYYLAPGAPDTTLFAFAPADLASYIGGSVLVAFGLATSRSWAWPLLCVHSGAIVYSALYGLALPLFSGGGWGSLMMLPSMILEPVFAWLLRPKGRNDAGAPE